MKKFRNGSCLGAAHNILDPAVMAEEEQDKDDFLAKLEVAEVRDKMKASGQEPPASGEDPPPTDRKEGAEKSTKGEKKKKMKMVTTSHPRLPYPLSLATRFTVCGSCQRE